LKKSRASAAILAAVLLANVACAESPVAFEQGMNALLQGDFAEAYCQWKPLAEQGHAESQYNLGWLYANGNGVTVDMRQAFHWWNAAALQGHADAEFALGLSYLAGEGVKRDLEAAANWFYQAAQRGHMDARESLLRLAGDFNFDVLGTLPQLAEEPWFGWLGEVTGERVNVRAGPGTGTAIIAKLSRGEAVRVLSRRGDWLRIRLPQLEGGPEGADGLAWIYHSLLKPTGSRAAAR